MIQGQNMKLIIRNYNPKCNIFKLKHKMKIPNQKIVFDEKSSKYGTVKYDGVYFFKFSTNFPIFPFFLHFLY